MLKKLFILGLVCASFGLAQKGGGNKGGSDMGGGGGMGMAAAPNKFDSIATTLNLTKDQKKEVKTILDEGAKESTPLRDQITKSRVTVGEAIVAKKSDDELQVVARTSSDLQAQLVQLELKTFGKVVASLDETQKKDTQALSRCLTLMRDIYHTKNWNE